MQGPDSDNLMREVRLTSVLAGALIETPHEEQKVEYILLEAPHLEHVRGTPCGVG